ncbi:right-handed parallel beta-helix repeat-containing protein [uncultured Chloroflexus sp.]|uniref:right-handed parallel beta-helix repeat-containing protein n=1 Tax=uncultured Chloroflexus sp. TaxID=214040 RepID=UPI002609C589|nr:right-handed parallel beta-helix repeat-containing protein [uncultured Chloroflexus sp.]
MFSPSLQRLWRGIICLWLVIGLSAGIATAQPVPDYQAGSALRVLIDIPPATLANSYNITTDTTWTLANSPYYVASLSIDNNATLTIEPGVRVVFSQNGSVSVWQGTLRAIGTAAQPITFTGSTAEAGWWRELDVSGTGTAEIEQAVIEYGGGYGSVYADGAANLTLRNVTIRQSSGEGLRLFNRTGTTVLEQVTFANNRWGLAVYNVGNTSPIGAITLTGCTFQNNTEYGIYQDTINMPLTYTSHTFTGNGLADIGINGGDLSRTLTLGPTGAKVRVLNSFTVLAGATLTISPGTRLEFADYKKMFVEGALNAAGTATQPIVFTGVNREAGAWQGIQVQQAGSAILEYATIEYAGDFYNAGLSKLGSGNLTLRNSTISAYRFGLYITNSTGRHEISRNLFTGNRVGVMVQNQPSTIVLTNNLIENSSEYGVLNQDSATVLARYNWWGHASGPRHTTINPSGQGNLVSDGVLFYPWNDTRTVEQTIPTPTYVILNTSGPTTVSSGEQVDYRVTHENGTNLTVQNAVLLVRLPYLATYVESSAGGIYWPERQQVFWKLGDLAPGTQGEHWVRVQYDWGIPNMQADNTATFLIGTNYLNDKLDPAPYLSYVPRIVTAQQSLTRSQWDSVVASVSQLNNLFTAATADSFRWIRADRVTLNNGKTYTQAILLDGSSRRIQLLSYDGSKAVASTFAPGRFTVTDGAGGYEWYRATDEQWMWGSWDSANHAPQPGTLISPCGLGCCANNCLTQAVVKNLIGKVSTIIEAGFTAVSCYKAFETGAVDDTANCAANILSEIKKVEKIYPILSEMMDVVECASKCAGGSTEYDCEQDQITCDAAWYNIYAWLDVPSYTVWRCYNGCYSNVPQFVTCAFDQCCIPGVGCGNVANGGHCRPELIGQAHDPNEIRGLAGDVVPGQWMSYTIDYENMGSGRAYGVFVSAQLAPVFDPATLQLGSNATFYPDQRLMVWDIGELAPNGQIGSTGSVTMTVRLRSDLTTGTVVVQQATVYFPSAREETPTNTWINIVNPLVAVPQAVTTNYQTARTITLSGFGASGLIYEIVDQPSHGTLTGAPPNLTYTPGANVAGADAFTFRVRSGSVASRVAQVTITINASGDTTRPTILWSSPANNASGLVAGTTPVYTDTVGPVFAPAIMLGASEALDGTTVTTGTVKLLRANGTEVPIRVSYTPSSNQITIMPRETLSNGTYRVTVTTGVKDIANNTLAAPYTTSLTIGVPPRQVFVPMIQR